MAQDVTSLLRIIESESEGQLKTYASLVLSFEKRFIFFFGFIRTENGDSLFNGFRSPTASIEALSSKCRSLISGHKRRIRWQSQGKNNSAISADARESPEIKRACSVRPICGSKSSSAMGNV
jgi:hypothetical protein